MITALRRALEGLLLPELRQIPPHQHEPAMKRAGEEPFDFLEWAGMLLGLVLTAWTMRYGAAGLDITRRLAIVGANFRQHSRNCRGHAVYGVSPFPYCP